jgi:hypothetical protein
MTKYYHEINDDPDYPDNYICEFWLTNGRIIREKKALITAMLKYANSEKREIDIQCHLHGECHATPPELIAEELFILGFILGRNTYKKMTDEAIDEHLLAMGDTTAMIKNAKKSQRAHQKEVHMYARCGVPAWKLFQEPTIPDFFDTPVCDECRGIGKIADDVTMNENGMPCPKCSKKVE